MSSTTPRETTNMAPNGNEGGNPSPQQHAPPPEDEVFMAEDAPSDEEEVEDSLAPLDAAAPPPNDGTDDHWEVEQLRRLAAASGESTAFVSQPADLFTLESWRDQDPTDEGDYATGELQQSIVNFHRLLEATVGTDGIPLDLSCKAHLDREKEPHTRTFEAIGHYIPNLLRAREGRLLAADVKYLQLGGKHTSFRLSTLTAPLLRGWERYRLVNGKYADFRSGSRTGPKFAIFPDLPQMLALPCAAIKLSLTVEEMDSLVYKEPLSVGALFDEAVKRAGGVHEVKVIPYCRPRPDNYRDSRYMSLWLDLFATQQPVISLPPVASKSDAVRAVLQGLANRTLDDASERLFEVLKQLLGSSPTDEVLETIYDNVVPYFEGPHPVLPKIECTPKDLHRWATPVIEEDEEGDVDGTRQLVDYNLGGVNHVVDCAITAGDGYETPYPCFLAPENCSDGTLRVLALYSVSGNRVVAQHGTYEHVFPWYAMSVTPRKATDDRGIGLSEPFWHERMHAKVSFEGPIFRPREHSAAAFHLATVLNSAWAEEVVMQGRVSTYPKVFAYPGKTISDSDILDIPLNARGVGVANGVVTLSPLVVNKTEWHRHSLQDLRCIIPLRVLELLLKHPDVYSLENVNAHLEGLAPLVLLARKQDQFAKVVYTDSVIFHPEAPTASQCFGWSEDTMSVDNEPGGAVLRTPTVPARGKKLADTTDSDWGVPADRTHVSWQVKSTVNHTPYSEVTTFADKLTTTSIGNWSAAVAQLRAAGVSEEVCKNLYSVHWQSANSPNVHPLVKYHNPKWTETLKGAPPRREMWHWPTRKLAPSPLLTTNDAGQLPLTGRDLELHRKRTHKKEHARRFFQAQPGRGSKGGGGQAATSRSGAPSAFPRTAPAAAASGNLLQRLLETPAPTDDNSSYW